MSSYKKRNKGGSKPSIAAPGGMCQSRLINPDYSNARKEIACPTITSVVCNMINKITHWIDVIVEREPMTIR